MSRRLTLKDITIGSGYMGPSFPFGHTANGCVWDFKRSCDASHLLTSIKTVSDFTYFIIRQHSFRMCCPSIKPHRPVTHWQMFPRHSSNSLANGLSAHPVLFGEKNICGLGGMVSFPNRNHLCVRQFMGCGALSIAKIIPALLRHINRIIAMRPKKQMIRIAARRVITFMANLKIVRNVPSNQNPSQPVRARLFRVFSTNQKGSINATSNSRSEWPAIIWTFRVHLRPKQFRKWGIHSVFPSSESALISFGNTFLGHFHCESHGGASVLKQTV